MLFVDELRPSGMASNQWEVISKRRVRREAIENLGSALAAAQRAGKHDPVVLRLLECLIDIVDDIVQDGFV